MKSGRKNTDNTKRRAERRGDRKKSICNNSQTSYLEKLLRVESDLDKQKGGDAIGMIQCGEKKQNFLWSRLCLF